MPRTGRKGNQGWGIQALPERWDQDFPRRFARLERQKWRGDKPTPDLSP
ncbi:MAG: hypothetical protein HQM01_06220 [Magnetococcales bacterium]|nr:hypothetical protein [Magnetococcales bacterium]